MSRPFIFLSRLQTNNSRNSCLVLAATSIARGSVLALHLVVLVLGKADEGFNVYARANEHLMQTRPEAPKVADTMVRDFD